MEKLLRSFFIVLLILLFQNLLIGQSNDSPLLSNLIKENSEQFNFNKIDSITTFFLAQYPKIGEKEFQKNIKDLYTEDNLNQLASYYFINGLYYEKNANYLTAIKSYLTAIEFITKSNSNN